MYSRLKVADLTTLKISLILTCLLSIVPIAQAELPFITMDGQKIVTGSMVRIRTQPALTSEIVGHLNLGAVVRANRRTKDKLQTGPLHRYWYFVQTDQAQGWVNGSLLRDFRAEQKEQIWFELIKERLDNQDLSFSERVALYQFTRLVVKNAHDEKLQGAFELGQLLALQKSFDQLPYDALEKEPYTSWIREHQAARQVFHDEMSGQWLVPASDFWKLADKHQNGFAGDEIAWYAANAALGGECEGDIACHLERGQVTQGEYLRRYPLGRYANIALQRLTETLEYARTALQQEPDYFRHAPESEAVLDDLLQVIRATNPKLSEYPKAVEAIKAIRMKFQQTQG